MEFNILSKYICKIFNNKSDRKLVGTGFIIGNSKIITSWHVIKDNCLDRKKVFIEFNDKEFISEDCNMVEPLDIALLMFNEIISEDFMTIKKMDIQELDEYRTFGYPIFKGEPINDNVRMKDVSIKDYSIDIQLKCSEYNGMDFSGISGAPLIIGEEVVGIIQMQDYYRNMQQDKEWYHDLYAISFKKIEKYLLENNIINLIDLPIEEEINKRIYRRSNIVNIGTKNIDERRFYGRIDFLKDLNKAYSNHNEKVIKVIKGLGGMGKTQTAFKFCFDNRNQYTLIWWFDAEEAITIPIQYKELAKALGLEINDENLDRIVNNVKLKLEKSDNWLIVFDNASNPKEIYNYIPFCSKGNILITSRYDDWSEIGDSITLKGFEPDEAVMFIKTNTSDDDIQSIKTMCYELQNFPLALEHARAYMKKYHINAKEYLDEFTKHRLKIFEKSTIPLSYKDTILTTWETSFVKISEAHESSIEFVYVCAFLYSDKIPLYIFSKVNHRLLPSNLANIFEDNLIFLQVQGALLEHSLIEKNGKYIYFHSLVQEVIRNKFDIENEKYWAKIAFNIVYNVFPFNPSDHNTWKGTALMHLHVLTVCDHIFRLNLEYKYAFKLLQKLSQYFFSIGLYNEFKIVIDKIRNQIKLNTGYEGEGFWNFEFGMMYMQCGDNKQAISSFNSALDFFYQCVDLPNYKTNKKIRHLIVQTLSMLGIASLGVDNIKISTSYIERAVLLIENENVDKDIEVLAKVYNDYARILNKCDRFEDSIIYYQKALNLLNEKSDSNDQHKATIKGNIGCTLQKLRRYKDGYTILNEALRVHQSIFGDSNISCVEDYSNLVDAIITWYEFDQNECKSFFENEKKDCLLIAEQYLNKAISMIKDIHKSTDLHIKKDSRYSLTEIKIYHNLAILRGLQFDFEEAKKIYLDILDVCENFYKENKSMLAKIYNNLGDVIGKHQIHNMGNINITEMEKSLSYIMKALEFDMEIYNEDSLEVAIDMMNIGCCYIYLGNTEKVIYYLDKCYKIFCNILEIDAEYIIYTGFILGTKYIELNNNGNKYFDDIINRLISSNKKTKIIDYCIKISTCLLQKDINEALKYIEIAEKQCRSLPKNKIAAEVYYYKGVCLYIKQNFKLAKSYCINAKIIIEQQNNLKEIYSIYIGILNYLGRIEEKYKKYSDSSNYFENALNILLQFEPNNKEYISFFNKRIANLEKYKNKY